MKKEFRRKEHTANEKRSIHLQQVLFGMMALIIIFSMLLTLVAK